MNSKPGLSRRGFFGGLLAVTAAVALPLRKIAARPAEVARRIKTSGYERSGYGYILHFESVEALPSGCEAVVWMRPIHDFSPDRLVIPSAIGGSFIVTDIIIDRVSMFHPRPIFWDPKRELKRDQNAVPALIFSENAEAYSTLDSCVKGRNCPAGNIVEIRVKNISTEPQVFMAAMIGEVIEPATRRGPPTGMHPAFV